jgi:DNA mismatch repair protein MutL
MSRDDALLCFTRHATSKIQKVEDLSYLSTMGFRGEALSSIAAVSKVTLTTSQMEGIRLEVEAGNVLSIEPAARARGSTIEVRSLFYNVPARKKFQKSVPASSAEITKLLTFLSLAYPEVGLSLWHQGKKVFGFCAGECVQEEMLLRSKALLSQDFVEDMHIVEHKEEKCEIRGFVSSPTKVRSNRSGQYLFVNRRVVHCPILSYAVRDAFSTRIEKDRYPLFVLHCTIPSHLIDVNVHPQKKEIRIKEERATKNIMQCAVERALEKKRGTQPIISEPEISYDRLSRSFWTHEPIVLHDSSCNHQQELAIEHGFKPIGVLFHYLFLHVQPSLQKIVDAKDDVAMIAVDLYAAKAKIAFDNMMKHQGPRGSQALLLPITILLSKAEGEALLGILDDLQQIGLGISAIGEAAFLVESIPECIQEAEIKDFILQCLQGNQDLRERKYAAIVSGCIRKQRIPFSEERALCVLEELLRLPDPLFCPLGKRIISCITKDEIDGWFR